MRQVPFLIIIFSLLMTNCTRQKTTVATETFDLSSLDTTVAPGTSFYRYATGGWQDANPIPDEYARYGSFDQLREENQEQIQQLIQTLVEAGHRQGSNAQKVGTLYSIGMDSVKLNREGAEPIHSLLETITQASDKNDIIRLMAEISRYASNPFFGFRVGPDNKNS